MSGSTKNERRTQCTESDQFRTGAAESRQLRSRSATDGPIHVGGGADRSRSEQIEAAQAKQSGSRDEPTSSRPDVGVRAQSRQVRRQAPDALDRPDLSMGSTRSEHHQPNQAVAILTSFNMDFKHEPGRRDNEVAGMNFGSQKMHGVAACGS
jgi:hypothetical protein